MKATKQRSYQAIPWVKVARMALATKKNGEPMFSIQAIAEKLGYYNKGSKDPNQEMRGIMSRFRTIGIPVDSVPQLDKVEGIVKKGNKFFLPSATVRRGTGTAPKAAKPHKAVAAKPTPKVTVDKGKGKVATPKFGLALTGSGKMLRITAGKGEALVGLGTAMPQIVDLLDNAGYEVKQKLAQADVTEAGTSVTPEAQTEAAPVTEGTTPKVEVTAPQSETETHETSQAA